MPILFKTTTSPTNNHVFFTENKVNKNKASKPNPKFWAFVILLIFVSGFCYYFGKNLFISSTKKFGTHVDKTYIEEIRQKNLLNPNELSEEERQYLNQFAV
jgi:hypothetical protein